MTIIPDVWQVGWIATKHGLIGTHDMQWTILHIYGINDTLKWLREKYLN